MSEQTVIQESQKKKKKASKTNTSTQISSGFKPAEQATIVTSPPVSKKPEFEEISSENYEQISIIPKVPKILHRAREGQDQQGDGNEGQRLELKPRTLPIRKVFIEPERAKKVEIKTRNFYVEPVTQNVAEIMEDEVEIKTRSPNTKPAEPKPEAGEILPKIRHLEVSTHRIEELKVQARKELRENIEPLKELLEKNESLLESKIEEHKGLEEFKEFDFLEILFGEGAKVIRQGKACIIVPEYERRCEDMVAVICREIYREKKGGLPTPYQKGTIKELKLEPGHPIEGGVAIIEKVDDSDFEELIRLLKGFYSLDSGYLILISEKPQELKREILEEKTAAPVICLESLPIPGAEFKERTENLEKELIEKYLDYKNAPEPLRRMWHKLVSKGPTERKDEPEQASDIHSAIKAFVWRLLWEKSGKKSVPELEKPIGSSKKIFVDVGFGNENYEIETLFGVGDPIAKLTGRICEYESEGIGNIYFVLRPISILLHSRDLLTFKNDWKKQGKNVEIYSISIEGEELVPIERIVRGKT
jgi:hypothetical protein